MLSDAASLSLSASSEEEEEVDQGSSTGGSGGDQADQAAKTEDENIAAKETRAVWLSKVLVFGVLTIVAVAVGTATYLFVSNQEEDDFVQVFKGFANEVIDASTNNAKNTFNAISTFSSTITSYTLDQNRTWPNVTIPHFEVRGREVHKLAGSLLLTLIPLVSVVDRSGWESYSVQHQEWIEEGLDYGVELYGEPPVDSPTAPIHDKIYSYFRGGEAPVTGSGPYGPQWQQSPAPRNSGIVNLDLLYNPIVQRHFDRMASSRNVAVLSEVVDLRTLYGSSIESNANDPHSFLMQPVYNDFGSGGNLVGFLLAVIPWNNYFSNLVPPEVQGIYLVMENTCGDPFTYLIMGQTAQFLGMGDLHEVGYFESWSESSNFTKATGEEDTCHFTMRIYPSKQLYSENQTNKPLVYTIAIVSCFLLTSAVFLLYDWMVKRRQKKLMATAIRTTRIVSSLFPSNVRDRIMMEAEKTAEEEMNKGRNSRIGPAPKTMLKSFLHGNADDGEDGDRKTNHVFGSDPIADFFPQCTVLFADIVGFTAWSSVREPAQVFTLLETIYHAFDQVAKRRRVFKVETVGDCYVAVAGLPDPRKDHAIVMARFASQCLVRMKEVTRDLEISLGPDTGELGMRVGLHSGPVTAGVLRGERARFQLFGDTMNTASRMESTGEMNKIHVSKETAEMLVEAGRAGWLTKRETKVYAKGKGELDTYWLQLDSASSDDAKSSYSAGSSDKDAPPDTDIEAIEEPLRQELLAQSMVDKVLPDKVCRLVEWNVDVLSGLLRNIIVRRAATSKLKRAPSRCRSSDIVEFTRIGTVLDEVKEIIALPQFDPEVIMNEERPESIVVDNAVINQLIQYVTAIASMYRDNPFHNFEHASHVTMSVKKLLSRIVRPDAIDKAEDLHDHTYGITSDPLTQFAVVFAALIHDVDHSGVPNTILVQENSDLAAAYHNKSVAEQNSVDIAWALLMSPEYRDLRDCICHTHEELTRFRQLVVNTIMATDIMDKDLNALRKKRWDKAFEGETEESTTEAANRKATIVIEHLIQASDVSHTMQHWHIFCKWNESLFHENYRAFKLGRSDRDPSIAWYESEIGFFDFYIIPLAKKLATCGVFGVSSDEYLNYAQTNRREWELKGMEMVQKYLLRYEERYSA